MEESLYFFWKLRVVYKCEPVGFLFGC
jgi:hypothetical protein